MGIFFIIQFTKIKFKISRITVSKNFLPLKSFWMDFRVLRNTRFTPCALR